MLASALTHESGAFAGHRASQQQIIQLTNDGSSWIRDRSKNALEDGSNKTFLSHPMQLESVKDSLVVKMLENPANRSIQLALTDNGQVYVRGRDTNNSGILGLGDSVKEARDFTLIASLASQRIRKLSLGKAHAAAVDENGHLYMWGSGSNGQMTWLDSSTDSVKEVSHHVPTRIEKEKLSKVDDVVCRGNSTVVLSSNGSIYVLGDMQDEPVASVKKQKSLWDNGKKQTSTTSRKSKQVQCNWQSFVKISAQRDWGCCLLTKKGDIVFMNKFYQTEKLSGRSGIIDIFPTKDRLFAIDEEGLLDWDLGFILKNGFFSSEKRSGLDRNFDAKHYPPKFHQFSKNLISARLLPSHDSLSVALLAETSDGSDAFAQKSSLGQIGATAGSGGNTSADNSSNIIGTPSLFNKIMSPDNSQRIGLSSIGKTFSRNSHNSLQLGNNFFSSTINVNANRRTPSEVLRGTPLIQGISRGFEGLRISTEEGVNGSGLNSHGLNGFLGTTQSKQPQFASNLKHQPQNQEFLSPKRSEYLQSTWKRATSQAEEGRGEILSDFEQRWRKLNERQQNQLSQQHQETSMKRDEVSQPKDLGYLLNLISSGKPTVASGSESAISRKNYSVSRQTTLLPSSSNSLASFLPSKVPPKEQNRSRIEDRSSLFERNSTSLLTKSRSNNFLNDFKSLTRQNEGLRLDSSLSNSSLQHRSNLLGLPSRPSVNHQHGHSQSRLFNDTSSHSISGLSVLHRQFNFIDPNSSRINLPSSQLSQLPPRRVSRSPQNIRTDLQYTGRSRGGSASPINILSESMKVRDKSPFEKMWTQLNKSHAEIEDRMNKSLSNISQRSEKLKRSSSSLRKNQEHLNNNSFYSDNRMNRSRHQCNSVNSSFSRSPQRRTFLDGLVDPAMRDSKYFDSLKRVDRSVLAESSSSPEKIRSSFHRLSNSPLNSSRSHNHLSLSHSREHSPKFHDRSGLPLVNSFEGSPSLQFKSRRGSFGADNEENRHTTEDSRSKSEKGERRRKIPLTGAGHHASDTSLNVEEAQKRIGYLETQLEQKESENQRLLRIISQNDQSGKERQANTAVAALTAAAARGLNLSGISSNQGINSIINVAASNNNLRSSQNSLNKQERDSNHPLTEGSLIDLSCSDIFEQDANELINSENLDPSAFNIDEKLKSQRREQKKASSKTGLDQELEVEEKHLKAGNQRRSRQADSDGDYKNSHTNSLSPAQERQERLRLSQLVLSGIYKEKESPRTAVVPDERHSTPLGSKLKSGEDADLLSHPIGEKISQLSPLLNSEEFQKQIECDIFDGEEKISFDFGHRNNEKDLRRVMEGEENQINADFNDELEKEFMKMSREHVDRRFRGSPTAAASSSSSSSSPFSKNLQLIEGKQNEPTASRGGPSRSQSQEKKQDGYGYSEPRTTGPQQQGRSSSYERNQGKFPSNEAGEDDAHQDQQRRYYPQPSAAGGIQGYGRTSRNSSLIAQTADGRTQSPLRGQSPQKGAGQTTASDKDANKRSQSLNTKSGRSSSQQYSSSEVRKSGNGQRSQSPYVGTAQQQLFPSSSADQLKFSQVKGSEERRDLQQVERDGGSRSESVKSQNQSQFKSLSKSRSISPAAQGVLGDSQRKGDAKGKNVASGKGYPYNGNGNASESGSDGRASFGNGANWQGEVGRGRSGQQSEQQFRLESLRSQSKYSDEAGGASSSEFIQDQGYSRQTGADAARVATADSDKQRNMSPNTQTAGARSKSPLSSSNFAGAATNTKGQQQGEAASNSSKPGRSLFNQMLTQNSSSMSPSGSQVLIARALAQSGSSFTPNSKLQTSSTPKQGSNTIPKRVRLSQSTVSSSSPSRPVIGGIRQQQLRQSLDPSSLFNNQSRSNKHANTIANTSASEVNRLNNSSSSRLSSSSKMKRSSSLRFSDICDNFNNKMKQPHNNEKHKALERSTGMKISKYGDITNQSRMSLGSQTANPLRKSLSLKSTALENILPDDLKRSTTLHTQSSSSRISEINPLASLKPFSAQSSPISRQNRGLSQSKQTESNFLAASISLEAEGRDYQQLNQSKSHSQGKQHNLLRQGFHQDVNENYWSNTNSSQSLISNNRQLSGHYVIKQHTPSQSSIRESFHDKQAQQSEAEARDETSLMASQRQSERDQHPRSISNKRAVSPNDLHKSAEVRETSFLKKQTSERQSAQQPAQLSPQVSPLKNSDKTSSILETPHYGQSSPQSGTEISESNYHMPKTKAVIGLHQPHQLSFGNNLNGTLTPAFQLPSLVANIAATEKILTIDDLQIQDHSNLQVAYQEERRVEVKQSQESSNQSDGGKEQISRLNRFNPEASSSQSQVAHTSISNLSPIQQNNSLLTQSQFGYSSQTIPNLLIPSSSSQMPPLQSKQSSDVNGETYKQLRESTMGSIFAKKNESDFRQTQEAEQKAQQIVESSVSFKATVLLSKQLTHHLEEESTSKPSSISQTKGWEKKHSEIFQMVEQQRTKEVQGNPITVNGDSNQRTLQKLPSNSIGDQLGETKKSSFNDYKAKEQQKRQDKSMLIESDNSSRLIPSDSNANIEKQASSKFIHSESDLMQNLSQLIGKQKAESLVTEPKRFGGETLSQLVPAERTTLLDTNSKPLNSFELFKQQKKQEDVLRKSNAPVAIVLPASHREEKSSLPISNVTQAFVKLSGVEYPGGAQVPRTIEIQQVVGKSEESLKITEINAFKRTSQNSRIAIVLAMKSEKFQQSRKTAAFLAIRLFAQSQGKISQIQQLQQMEGKKNACGQVMRTLARIIHRNKQRGFDEIRFSRCSLRPTIQEDYKCAPSQLTPEKRKSRRDVSNGSKQSHRAPSDSPERLVAIQQKQREGKQQREGQHQRESHQQRESQQEKDNQQQMESQQQKKLEKQQLQQQQARERSLKENMSLKDHEKNEYSRQQDQESNDLSKESMKILPQEHLKSNDYDEATDSQNHAPTYADPKEFEPDICENLQNLSKDELQLYESFQQQPSISQKYLLQRANSQSISDKQSSQIYQKKLSLGSNTEVTELGPNESGQHQKQNQHFERYLSQFNLSSSQHQTLNNDRVSTQTQQLRDSQFVYEFAEDGNEEEAVATDDVQNGDQNYSEDVNLLNQNSMSQYIMKMLNQSQQYALIPENLQPGYVHREKYKELLVAPILNYADVKPSNLSDKKLNEQSLHNPPAQHLPGYKRVISSQKQFIGRKFQILHNQQVTGRELSISPHRTLPLNSTFSSPRRQLSLSSSNLNIQFNSSIQKSPTSQPLIKNSSKQGIVFLSAIGTEKSIQGTNYQRINPRDSFENSRASQTKLKKMSSLQQYLD